MASRLQLQATLESLLGSQNVYFNPPSSFKMEYDCIRYSNNNFDTKRADDKNYLITDGYEIVYIHRKPNEPLKRELLSAFEMISFDRSYVSDNLHHDVYTLYY